MPSETQWYYARAGQQLGPVSIDALREMLAQAQVSATDLVWSEGMEAWQPAEQIRDLLPTAPQHPQPPLPASPAQPVIAQYASAPVPAYYGARPIPYYPSSQSYNGFAIAGFVLALMPGFSFLGLIFSWIALNGMKRSGNIEGHGLAKAGLIISCVWLGLGLLSACIWFTAVAVALGVAGAGH